MYKNWEIPVPPTQKVGRSGKAKGRKPDMYETGKSNINNPPNKAYEEGCGGVGREGR